MSGVSQEASVGIYPPTVLAAVGKGMPAFDEETFGPGAAVIRAQDEAHAIRLANDSEFGLGASLWTEGYSDALRDTLDPRLRGASWFMRLRRGVLP